MKKNVINEISQMKFLFGYKPGRVLSEQELPEMEDLMVDGEMEDLMVDDEMSDIMVDDEMSDFDFGPEVAPTPTRERERTKEREKTEKPFRPSRPSRNPDELPGYNPHPQGSEEDEIEYELEIDDMPMRDMDRPMRRPMNKMRDMDRPRRGMRDMDENIYEIVIDDDIENLFR